MASNKSHIAIHLHCLFNGGIERIMANLTHNFIERGLQVDLVLNYLGNPAFRSEFPAEVRIIDLKADKIQARLPRLIRYLRQHQPTALLSANHYANEMAILAKYLSRVPTKVVVSDQTNLSVETKKKSPLSGRYWAPLALKLLYPGADGRIAPSIGVAQDLVSITGLPIDKFQVIYNPVINPTIFAKAKEPVDHPWFAPGELPVILAAGRLEKQKDFPTLIRAFAKVREVTPSRLVIFGTGSEHSRLKSLINELDLEDYVDLPGFTKNPYAYVAKSAVLTLSSAWEGLPTFLIETMALGIPVVSTDCPSGPAEILDNGKYGDLVPVDDPPALAEAILNILSGNYKSASLDWLEQFTVEQTTQKYLDMLGIQVE
ncbi:MAG: glycosyltransferase [Calothrix sp. MO_167.B12]|nr:glycosyltransferase [Calothrix sp. MO_167.B12]